MKCILCGKSLFIFRGWTLEVQNVDPMTIWNDKSGSTFCHKAPFYTNQAGVVTSYRFHVPDHEYAIEELFDIIKELS